MPLFRRRGGSRSTRTAQQAERGEDHLVAGVRRERGEALAERAPIRLAIRRRLR